MADRRGSIEDAKFAPPALDAALPRPALRERLQAFAAPCKWLHGISGAGKSMLAADYARHRAMPGLWYRLDARDAEPGFFFAEFGRGLARVASPRRALPRFSDADRAQVRDFARRFFAAALAAFGRPALLVFDDVQHVAGTPTATALAALAEAMSAPGELLLVADRGPDEVYWEALARRQLTICNDLDLALDASECEAVAQLQRLRGVAGADLAALTGGHAATLALACELLRAAHGDRADRSRQVHAFMLDKVMAGLDAGERDALLSACLMARSTAAQVAALTGADDAAGRLDRLAARGLLQRHVLDDGVIYEAHGLMRAGAATAAARLLGGDEARRRASRAMALLRELGRLEEAFELALQLGEPGQGADLLESLAERHARERRPALALAAAERLPPEVVDARPWIPFWVGHALLGNDEAGARAWFERSHAAFSRAGDASGAALAAASVLIGYGAEEGDLAQLQTWVARFRSVRGAASPPAREDLRTVLQLGLVCAANVADDASDLESEADRVLTELGARLSDPGAWLSPDLQMTAATLLLAHAHAFCTLARARQIALVTESVARDERHGALLRGRWWLANASLAEDEGDAGRMRASLAEVDRLVAETGLRRLDFAARLFRIEAGLKSSLDGAAALLAGTEALAAQLSLTEMARFGLLATRVLTLQRRWPEAVARAEAALQLAHQAGLRGGHARVFEVRLASALAGAGRHAEAAARLEALDPLLSGTQRALNSAIAGALRHLAADGEAGALARALAAARETSFHTLLQAVPDVIARLCDDALALDIEPAFVRELIAHQRLRPPPGARASWPWPVRVWGLGPMHIEIQGAPYRPASKAQDKPLDLLRLLLAAAAQGRVAIDKGWAAEQLWPDADAANARKALDMTIIRLRRLLQSETAVQVVEGRLQLAADEVWTDIGPLRAALADVLRLLALPPALAGDPARGTALAEALATLATAYAGPLLQGENDAAWVLGARAHLSREFRAAVQSCSALLSEPLPPRLLPALEQALRAEPTSEDIARLLMRMHASRGATAEALRVFQYCRQMLASLIGVAPSAQTEALRAEITAAAPAGQRAAADPAGRS